MVILNKLLYIYLPISLLVGFCVLTVCFYAAPISMSYYMNSIDHDPTHNNQYLGMAIPFYYLLAFVILNFAANFTLTKTGLISYAVAGAFFLVCAFGSFTASLSHGNHNRIGGLNAIILKPIELYELFSKKVTAAPRLNQYKEYLLKPDVPMTRSLAKAVEEVEAAANKEADKTKKAELLEAVKGAKDRLEKARL